MRRVQICPSCFAQESDDAKFCGLCGKALVDVKAGEASLVGVVLDDKYVIRELIARGGMGEVYLGEHTKLRQKVAVKILNRRYRGDQTVIKRFFNEAASYCRVSHPNAVKLHDFGKLDDDTLYMIMEFVPGETLTRHLARLGPLGNRRTLQLGQQLADVLLAAHSQGVIHRDLKPDNIMLVEVSPGRHQLKVLDFGIAKFLDDAGNEQLTEANLIFGTPEFMSPEQAQGLDTDHRADIYAFGMLLYYMVTANLPFHGGAKLSILNRQIHETPKRPREIAPKLDILPELEAIILKCIAKRRDDRYADFARVLDDLERVASGQPPSISTTAPTRPEVPPGTSPSQAAPRRPGADPLQAMFDRAPGRAALAPNASPNDAVTVVRDSGTSAPVKRVEGSASAAARAVDPHEAETRVAPRTGGGVPDATRRVGRPSPRTSDSSLELGDLDATTIADSGPLVLGSTSEVGPSSPRILGRAPEINATAPRILGKPPAAASDSGPFVITPEPRVHSEEDIPIVIADASRPGRPVDEELVTSEQELDDDDLDEPALAPPPPRPARQVPLSLAEDVRREEASLIDDDGPRLLGGPDDEDDDDGFVLGDATLLSPEQLELNSTRPPERRGTGAIIGLVLMLLAVAGAALWYFVLREPDAGATSDASAARDTTTTTTTAPPAPAPDDGITSPTPSDPAPDKPAPPTETVTPLPPSTAISHTVRALGTVRALEGIVAKRLDEGDFDGATRLLEHVQKQLKDALDDHHASEIGALVVRRDSARQILNDALKDTRRDKCSSAAAAVERLQPLSAGAAASLQEAVTKCQRRLAAPPTRVD